MRLFILAALVVAIAASPLGDNLLPRAVCSSLRTTTVAGTKATGPFKLTSKGSFSKAGNYASFRRPGATVTFDIPPSRDGEANDFYLDERGRLMSEENGGIYVGYELQPNGAGAVKIGTDGNSILSCSINKATCALDCKVNGFSYDCLSSPGYKPDWRIAASKEVAGRACLQFTPVVVPT